MTPKQAAFKAISDPWATSAAKTVAAGPNLVVKLLEKEIDSMSINRPRITLAKDSRDE